MRFSANPASSDVKYRNASEFEAAGFRVKRGMTISKRFLKKLNEYIVDFPSASYSAAFAPASTALIIFSTASSLIFMFRPNMTARERYDSACAIVSGM